MAVDYDTFLKWAIERFGAENIKIKGDEICTHSIFEEDHKYHLWMNPSGGKDCLPGGVYRCWYSENKMGSLVSLVAELDHISYEEAEELICGVSSLRSLEQKVHEFYGSHIEEVVRPVRSNVGLQLPPYTFDILSESCYIHYKERAIAYLNDRKIPIEGLYVCTYGDYKNRIIIPYYDMYGNLVYYNARTMDKNEKTLRYRKPDDENYKQDEVLFMKTWPKPGSKVYITEGEFDAISLNVCGFYGAACGGKSLSDAQIEILRNYIPVLALDRDEGKKTDSGGEALIHIGNQLLSKGFEIVNFVRPPKGYKDWNNLLKEKNEKLVKAYIEKYERPFTSFTTDHLRYNAI